MKINIIGSGWLAQPLALKLQANGHELLLTTTQTDKVASLQDKGLNAIEYEIGDQLAKPALLFDSDVLIIAITSKEVEAYDVLMDQLTEQNCQHVIYISSTSVYLNDGQSHTEDSTALNQDHPIAQIEQLIKTHPSASIIRFAGLVGPKRHPGRFFAHGKVLSNPNAPVNLIHLDDCIGIIESVIAHKAWNQTFNGCADTHPSKLAFYQQAAKQLGLAEPVFDESHSTSYKTIDNHKVKTQLKYKFVHPDVMDMLLSIDL